MNALVWPKNINDAKAIQENLKDKVKIIPLRKMPKFVSGVDAAFCDDRVIAVACVYKYPKLVHVEDVFAVNEISFPYVPGYLSFREGPAIIKALRKLKTKPDVVLFDGQGIAHPLGLGIASHIGVILNMPAIGCAKSKLVGEYRCPQSLKGKWTTLKYKGKSIGAVLRTKKGIRPLFISAGHLIDLKGSIEMVLGCTGKYRIPEPLRRADHLSKELKNFICGG